MKAVRLIFRTWLTASLWAVAAVLVACGGGSTNVSSLPGTGGTGITATGPIAGFGSVVVNGTRYDDAGARVQIDGDNSTQNQLRLGMVANITGIKSYAAVTPTTIVTAKGTASSIEVWSIAQGTVTSVVVPDKFSVAGMTMLVDAGTVFENAMSVYNLSNASVVKVWGQPTTADFSQWAVTRVEVLASAVDTVSTGKIVVRGATPTLNGFALLNSPLALKDGLLVRASGSLITGTAGTGTLTVSKITALTSTGTTAPISGYAELQGVVTSVLATNTATPAKITRLMLGTVEVDTSNAVVSPPGASIAQGSRIEVEGNWSAGVLVALKVEAKSEEQQQEVEIQGTIEQFTSVSNFKVRGQRCDASGLTKVGNGSLASLAFGKRVSLHGVKNGDVVKVTELEIKLD